MCNEVARRIALGQLREDFSQVRITLVFPEGAPNMAPLESVRITDTTTIVRAAADASADESALASGSPQNTALRGDLVSRRWSWPGPGGRPVFNYRSDGRDLANHGGGPGSPRSSTSWGGKGGRCLVPVDSFFEFTAAKAGERKKTKWRFTAADADWFCIAGLWRADKAVGEAFTLLTCPPGPDIASYHDRQVVVLPREHWRAWLDGSAPSTDLCRPSPAGSFAVEQVTG